MKKSFTILVVLLTSLSCYNNIEECLDPQATNFNPEADEDCCCVYPNLRLDVLYSFDTLDYSDFSVYPHAVHGQFSVIDFGIVLSRFGLSDGTDTLFVQDSTEFDVKMGQDTVQKWLRDDIMVLGDRFNYTIGEIRQPGLFQSLVFTANLDPQYDQVIADELDGHALSSLNDKGYWQVDRGYDEAFLEVAYGPDLLDTVRWVSGPDGFGLNLSLNGPFQKEVASDLLLPVNFDIQCWLGDVDLSQNSDDLEEALKSSLLSQNCLKIRQ